MKVLWSHDFDTEPVELVSEIGEDGYEVRKVDVYRDGRLDWADADSATGSTFLSTEEAMPLLDEINAQAEFLAVTISAAEFERVWSRAQAKS
ncbi:DUF6881 domain-containing protein [Nocardia brasiliensis]|uniref:DUF6881 domain-containing protein n=1 Tax=Nocardia brasiliensis TaxID=37326 RepID=UPI0024575A8E|nr:hypothetical protein [Nocardia brasiliensis]